MRRVIGELRRAPEFGLIGLIAIWFLPFFGVPTDPTLFYLFSGLLLVLGLVVGELALPVLAFLLLFFPQSVANGTGVYTITFVLGAAFALSVRVYLRSPRRDGLLPTRRLFVSSLIVAGGLAISVACATMNGVPFGQQVAVLRVVGLAALILVFLLGASRRTAVELVPTVKVIQAAGLIFALLVIVQAAWGYAPFADEYAQAVGYTSSAFSGRAGGTMGHPIIAGIVLVVAGLVVLACRTQGWWLAAPICLLASIPTGSRSAWLAAAIGLVVWLGAALRPRLRPMVFAGLTGATVLLAIGALVTLALEPVQRFLASSTALSRLNVFADSSAGYRRNRVEHAWQLISDSPLSFLLGHGPGYGAEHLRTVGIGDGQPDTFDQSYLALWVDFGLVGVLATFVPIAWIVIRRAGRAASLLAVVFLVASAFVMVTNWAALVGVAVLAAVFAVNDRAASGDVALLRDRSDEAAVDPVEALRD